MARKASPTPASGYYQMHVEQERTLIERAFADPETLPQPVATPATAGAAPRRERS